MCLSLVLPVPPPSDPLRGELTLVLVVVVVVAVVAIG